MIETYRGKVYPNQLDHMGHMNVQWYTAKFDEATWHLLSHIGINNRYIRESHCGMAALEQKISYKAEVMSGDLLVVKSEILEVANKTVRFKHHMFNAETGSLAATSELLGVHLDRNERKSTPLPDFAKANCDKLITTAE
ncbi:MULTISPECIES: acyl-CoA thioesterase [Vibrio]|uniref:acyl-CoA thioesterase n=1 Tax=Vibrio TaxID=662 RepID=UPI001C95C6B8|nr:thioesterase family protein [Vibrio hangzhouensis]MBY6197345.1 acyl-CoA thioesterase [Vibrio hangzhouensis]GMQ48644.1 acyl-CoA thioesterase [Vibrio sp. 10N]